MYVLYVNKNNLNCLRFSYNDHKTNFHSIYVINIPFIHSGEQMNQILGRYLGPMSVCLYLTLIAGGILLN